MDYNNQQYFKMTRGPVTTDGVCIYAYETRYYTLKDNYNWAYRTTKAPIVSYFT